MATYPGGVLAKGDVVNFVDVVDEGDHNILKNEIIAMQNYIGTNPQGDRASLNTRVSDALSGSGGFVLTTGIPVLSTYPGRFYYRIDLDTAYVVKNDLTIQALGAAIGNCVFSAGSCANTGSIGNFGYVAIGHGTAIGGMPYWANATGNYQTMFVTQLYRIAGMTSITLKALVTVNPENIGDTEFAKVRLTVGGIVGTPGQSTVAGTNGQTEWISSSAYVVGLSTGTYYDVIVELAGTDTAGPYSNSSICRMYSLIGIAS